MTNTDEQPTTETYQIRTVNMVHPDGSQYMITVENEQRGAWIREFWYGPNGEVRCDGLSRFYADAGEARGSANDKFLHQIRAGFVTVPF